MSKNSAGVDGASRRRCDNPRFLGFLLFITFVPSVSSAVRIFGCGGAALGYWPFLPETNSGMLIGDEKWMSLNLQARSSLTFRHEAVRKTTGVRCNVGSDSIYLELSQLNSRLREGVLKILSSIRSDLLGRGEGYFSTT